MTQSTAPTLRRKRRKRMKKQPINKDVACQVTKINGQELLCEPHRAVFPADVESFRKHSKNSGLNSDIFFLFSFNVGVLIKKCT